MSKPENMYSLHLINNDTAELSDFAATSIKLVKEIDQKPVVEEMHRIKARYHIDHCFILRNQERLGVIRIIKGTFYSLGLPDGLSNGEIDQILDLIESDIRSWTVNRVEATIHESFVSYLLKRKYTTEFSRIKMHLDLSSAKNLSDYADLKIQTFQFGDMEEIIKTFVDAYKGGIDEQIGMFGSDIATSAIQSVLQGNFGKFKPELSPVILDDDKSIKAAILTTIAEQFPFIVIIGVRRDLQNQGIGRKIISWLINESKRRGYEGIRLWVTVANQSAKSLYESIGFEQQLKIYTMFKFF